MHDAKDSQPDQRDETTLRIWLRRCPKRLPWLSINSLIDIMKRPTGIDVASFAAEAFAFNQSASWISFERAITGWEWINDKPVLDPSTRMRAY
jgi:hypothetical protein